MGRRMRQAGSRSETGVLETISAHLARGELRFLRAHASIKRRCSSSSGNSDIYHSASVFSPSDRWLRHNGPNVECAAHPALGKTLWLAGTEVRYGTMARSPAASLSQEKSPALSSGAFIELHHNVISCRRSRRSRWSRSWQTASALQSRSRSAGSCQQPWLKPSRSGKA